MYANFDDGKRVYLAAPRRKFFYAEYRKQIEDEFNMQFEDITEEVRRNSKLFLMIVNASIPFIALYNGGAALFRVMPMCLFSLIFRQETSDIRLRNVLAARRQSVPIFRDLRRR